MNKPNRIFRNSIAHQQHASYTRKLLLLLYPLVWALSIALSSALTRESILRAGSSASLFSSSFHGHAAWDGCLERMSCHYHPDTLILRPLGRRSTAWSRLQSSSTSSDSTSSSTSSSQSLEEEEESSSSSSPDRLIDLPLPLSSVYEEDDEDGPPNLFGRDHESLRNVTMEFLHDRNLYPLGKLTEEDVEAITDLMGVWARRRSLDSALTVEALLKRIIDDLKAGNTEIRVTTHHYTLTIDAWSKSGETGACERAQQIHDTMTQEYLETGNEDMRPTVLSYTTLANAWAKSYDTRASYMAECVLQSMIKAYHNGHADMKPDAVTFSTVMDAYTRSPGLPPQDACKRCEELFALMDELGVQKNVYTFSALQNVYARSGLPNALDRAKELLDQMQKLYQAGDVFAKPNCRNYNAILNAASRLGTLEAAKLAKDVLEKMEKRPIEGGYDVEPDRVSYTLAILACSRIDDKCLAAEMSLEILEKMERRANQEEERRKLVSSAAPPNVRMDYEIFNVVLTALSRTATPQSPNQIRRVLRKMQHYADKGKEWVRPNVRSWNTLLNSLARARSKRNQGTEALAVLKHMFRLHNRGVPNVLPDAFSFAAVLTAYQREATVHAAESADRLVREMEELYEKGVITCPPDVYHFTILAGVWAKSEQGQKGADRCLEILAHMMDRHKAGYPHVKPNVRTFNAVMDCLARADDGDRIEQLLYHMLSLYRKGDVHAKPDSFSFNCAISAFTRSKKKGSGRRAEAILDRFLEYQENENPAAIPDARSFTNIIAHYGKSKWLVGTGSGALDSPYRAEYVFNRMVSLFKDGRKYLEPNIFAITTVIDSYSMAKHPDAGANAERLLRLVTTLREKYGAKKLTITTTLMNSVLFAWSNSGDANAGNRAAAHVQWMEEEYASGNNELAPDTSTYSHLLNAISKSAGKDKAQRALDAIKRMKQHVKNGNQAMVLHEHHYSLAINACAFSNADIDSEIEAFKIATSLFDELLSDSDLKPTTVTYGWFIQCCGRLRVPQSMKNAYIVRAFRTCCEEGLVNDFVLKRLIGAASVDLLEKLLLPTRTGISWNPGRVRVSMLPKSWTANVGQNAYGGPRRGRDRSSFD